VDIQRHFRTPCPTFTQRSRISCMTIPTCGFLSNVVRHMFSASVYAHVALPYMTHCYFRRSATFTDKPFLLALPPHFATCLLHDFACSPCYLFRVQYPLAVVYLLLPPFVLAYHIVPTSYAHVCLSNYAYVVDLVVLRVCWFVCICGGIPSFHPPPLPWTCLN